jgi:hypothetical protein
MRGAVMRGLRLGVLLASGGLIAGGFMARAAATAAPDTAQAPEKSPPPSHAAFDATDCQTCHDDQVKGMRSTYHSSVEGILRRLPWRRSRAPEVGFGEGRAGSHHVVQEAEAGGSQQDLPHLP